MADAEAVPDVEAKGEEESALRQARARRAVIFSTRSAVRKGLGRKSSQPAVRPSAGSKVRTEAEVRRILRVGLGES